MLIITSLSGNNTINASRIKLIQSEYQVVLIGFYCIFFTCNIKKIFVILRSSPPELILGKGFLKICSKFIGERLCQTVVSIKLLCNFIEMTLWHECSPVNLLHIFRTPFPKNTSGGLHLSSCNSISWNKALLIKVG